MEDIATAPAALAAEWHRFLRDLRLVHADKALSWAAVHDPELRSLALRWFDELVVLPTPHIGRQRATAVAVFADGTTWHAALHDEPLGERLLADTIAALFTAPMTGEDA
ncbi:hypothetical protein [Spongiactinospora sp. TRM90649]|uniref:hypothetical protein n=1 Tax=Spongiactinospora sp. TRM90649 TaxID=3031114 RepID=UPI0023F9F53C|nr:hypothetical protein [Spongiactinospora sp. TRM90649]MDF5752191.1 hypothetical protein [Spongiactinospora sp. TRM90649]